MGKPSARISDSCSHMMAPMTPGIGAITVLIGKKPAWRAVNPAAAAALMVSTRFLLLLDVSGGLPFLLAVKPSERTEMAAVYSTFRDVSGIFTPGMAWLVLLVAPLPGLFAAMGLSLLACWGLAGTLPERLGRKRQAAG